MKMFPVKFRNIFEVFTLQASHIMFWAQFHDSCIQKQSCLLWSSDAFSKFSICKFYEVLAHFQDNCSQKQNCLVEVQMYFGNLRLVSFIKKIFGAISRFVRPKTKVLAVKFRRILQVLHLQGLQKLFWMHFHNLCVHKWTFLLWSSDAFLQFSICKVYRKSSGCIFTVYVSKNEDVCIGVQM